MKEIIQYQCEICGDLFSNKKKAIECESLGIPELYQIGLVFMRSHIHDIIFAIIKQNLGAYSKHYHSYLTWACRDNGYGDNVGGSDFCGLDSWSEITAPNKNIPAYKRMVQALKEANIEPINYLSDWLPTEKKEIEK